MVGNEHHRARQECPPDPAGGICKQQGTNSQLRKNSDRKSRRVRVVSLVEMEPATLRENVFPRQLSSNQFSAVSHHGGLGKAGYLTVWNGHGILDAGREEPETGSQHYRH